MPMHDKLTTEHIQKRPGNRFAQVNDAIRLAEYWIRSGRDPIDSENTAVEVMSMLSQDPSTLDRVEEILATPPEPKEEVVYQAAVIIDDEDEDDDE